MSAPTVIPGWFSIRGAAAYTGFSDRAIRYAIGLEKFPASQVTILGGGKKNLRIRREDLDAWILGTNQEPKAP